MGREERRVEELVGMYERGELLLPEMQRGYVWRAPRVRDLVDSLYRGYPSGAILVWETDGHVPIRTAAVDQNHSPYAGTKLLLDGQQRITSLSAVIRGKKVGVRGRRKPIDLLFNLEHPDSLTIVTEVDEQADDDKGNSDLFDADEDAIEHRLNQLTFVVATNKLARLPQWVQVTDVFATDDNAPFIEQAGVDSFKDPRFKKYSDRLNRLRAIRDYTYRVDILERSLTYEEVTEIFVRVNSLGAKLRSSDLAIAQITAKWRDSLKIFEGFQKHCSDAGFNLPLGIHVKNMVAFATGQSRFKTLGGLPVKKLQDGWEECQRGMEFSVNFLKSNVGITSPALLSSPFLMIAVGYFAHQRNYELSTQDASSLGHWLLIANTKGRYSRGATETTLDQDLAAARQDDAGVVLLKQVETQFGRLTIQPADLESRNARSAYFKAMFMAFHADGAKDWTSNLAISLSHSGVQHRLQFHHVFPRAVLKGQYRTRDINDIANLAFIGGKTNRKISSKPPNDYLPAIEPEALKSQCIPLDRDLWTVDRYPDFLVERRRLIADRLDAYLSNARNT